jgi:hypothetical protein
MFHFFRVFNKISFKYFIRILENQTLNYKFDDHVITHKGTFSTQPSQKQLIEGNWRTFCGNINNLLPFKGEKHSFYSDKSVEFYFPFPVFFALTSIFILLTLKGTFKLHSHKFSTLRVIFYRVHMQNCLAVIKNLTNFINIFCNKL